MTLEASEAVKALDYVDHRLACTLASSIAHCDLNDGAAAIAVVQRVIHFAPVRVLLDDASQSTLRARLRGVSEQEAIDLVKEWQRLAHANASLVDYAEVLTSCTGSNTAPYFLGAGQSAAAALFYLVKVCQLLGRWRVRPLR